jgi:CRISPR system Cascade subunit CasC
MKLIELHILQSFPVSCLNRDDVGAPKTAVFGGVNRARLSSQCLKRAIREEMRRQAAASSLIGDSFKGTRTKRLVKLLADAIEPNQSESGRVVLAESIAAQLSALTSSRDESGQLLVSTLTYLTPSEINAIGQAVTAKPELRSLGSALAQARDVLSQAEEEQENRIKEAATKDNQSLQDAWKKRRDGLKRDVEDKQKKCAAAMLSKDAIGSAIRSVHLKDGADIAIFGRMVASDPSLTVEGAAMFSHALSTHKADNDIDFFSAVDDAKPKEEDAGAGMIGTLEFTSAVYYRYAAINLDLLADKDHIGEPDTSAKQRQAIVDAFLRAVVLAVPSARHNAMNAHTGPAYVLGIYRETGQPMQLVNAFEQPIWSRNGLVAPSCRQLLLHRDCVNAFFELKDVAALASGWHLPTADSKNEATDPAHSGDEGERKILTPAMIPKHLNLDDFSRRLSAYAH